MLNIQNNISSINFIQLSVFFPMSDDLLECRMRIEVLTSRQRLQWFTWLLYLVVAIFIHMVKVPFEWYTANYMLAIFRRRSHISDITLLEDRHTYFCFLEWCAFTFHITITPMCMPCKQCGGFRVIGTIGRDSFTAEADCESSVVWRLSEINIEYAKQVQCKIWTFSGVERGDVIAGEDLRCDLTISTEAVRFPSSSCRTADAWAGLQLCRWPVADDGGGESPFADDGRLIATFDNETSFGGASLGAAPSLVRRPP